MAHPPQIDILAWGTWFGAIKAGTRATDSGKEGPAHLHSGVWEEFLGLQKLLRQDPSLADQLEPVYAAVMTGQDPRFPPGTDKFVSDLRGWWHRGLFDARTVLVAQFFAERFEWALLQQILHRKAWVPILLASFRPDQTSPLLRPALTLAAGRPAMVDEKPSSTPGETQDLAAAAQENGWLEEPHVGLAAQLRQTNLARCRAHGTGALAAVAPRPSDEYTFRAARTELLDYADQHVDVVAGVAPALLAGRADSADIMLVQLAAVRYQEVREALADAAGRGITAAEGLLQEATAKDTSLLDDMNAWWLDHNRYVAPRRVGAPSRTFLGSGELEDEVIQLIEGAVRGLRPRGTSDETEVTGALIERLCSAFDGTPLQGGTTGRQPLVVSITSQDSTRDERTVGADIGILIGLHLPGVLEIETGHLVQVKQSLDRSGENPPVWKIDIPQLDKLLAHDPTATYWLLAQHKDERVLSVPAKYLKAVAAGRGVQATADLRYEDVRHAAVPLSEEIFNMFLGLWIGSQDAAATAAGQNTNHIPAHMFSIDVSVERHN